MRGGVTSSGAEMVEMSEGAGVLGFSVVVGGATGAATVKLWLGSCGRGFHWEFLRTWPVPGLSVVLLVLSVLCSWASCFG